MQPIRREGGNYTLSLIKRMSKEERTTFRDGAIYTGLFTGAFAYFHYRSYIKKQFKRSEAHYRLGQTVQNCTPWKQMYFTWWRMPEEEWTVYHRFKPYYVIGQMDYSKEVLIPRTKVIDGKSIEGFDVVNPFYCYEGGKISLSAAMRASGDPISVERAAIIVKRGWVPAAYKERTSRPLEQNSRELVKITGCFMPGKNVHDYSIPNNPDSGEWNNLCLEDLGIYWDLPNFDELKYYYFHQVDLGGSNQQQLKVSPVLADSPDDVIEQYYEWRWAEPSHQKLYVPFGVLSAGAFALATLAL